jgi:hypothetical protein
MRWDLYCHVIDNHGDLGVCWRLATDLAGRGDRVRLFVDDATALSWMAPQGCVGVRVMPFDADADADADAGADVDAGLGEARGHVAAGTAVDVIVEAFGCDPPPARIAGLGAAQVHSGRPVWINLEYLSAEAYVERSHGLRSPQRDGSLKWFFYPGFTAATGGLLRNACVAVSPRHDGSNASAHPAAGDDPTGRVAFREGSDAAAETRAEASPDSALDCAPAAARSALAALAAALGLDPDGPERWVSLFCYADPAPPLAGWLADLAAMSAHDARPTRVLLTPGAAQALAAALTPGQIPPGVQLNPLPWLAQPDYDTLLRACAFNAVRGEDSLVQAIWAGRPWLWHIYPQDDGAHRAKLDAMLQRLLAADPALAAGPLGRALPQLAHAWNGLGATWPGLPTGELWDDWGRLCSAWRAQLAAQTDLATQLRAFAAQRLPRHR